LTTERQAAWELRPFEPADAVRLADVYRDAVRSVAPKLYTPEQVAAWASWPDDLAAFRDKIAAGTTLVAAEGGDILAFGQLEPDDHLSLLYCRGAHCRRGIATALCDSLEAIAWARGVTAIRTEASWISRPFFERRGYRLIEIENLLFGGVAFDRSRMSKARSGAAGPGA
jgi:putative acetyltransferase